MIHGWSASRTYVNPLAIELVRMGFKVVAIDQPGHQSSEPLMVLGASIKDIRKMAVTSLERTLRAADAIIEAAKQFAGGDAKGVLIGHSLGGALSIIGATQFQEESISTAA